MNARPLKLAIAALGGQGGGVLTDWLIAVAESEQYLVQSTSVPGVAQRTGATLYYLELCPLAAAEGAGREPVMALMPVPGDVDCVVAAELVEAGRTMQRGLVTPERTVLIASSHRAYTISEKSALGAGAVSAEGLIELAGAQAKRLVLFDMAQTAERHHSVISSVLLGAIAGSGVLPFARQSFVQAIERSGIAVAQNLAAFDDAYQQAAQGGMAPTGVKAALRFEALPQRAHSAQFEGLLERMRALPPVVQPLVLTGARRVIDYQDRAYAECYLERLERIFALEQRLGGEAQGWALLSATARALALWMSFEDTFRVADLKTRGERFERVRREARAAPGQIVGITDFMKPRVAEIAGTMPARLGIRVLSSPRLSRWLARWTGGRQMRTHTVSGYLALRMLARLSRWRRGTLRFREENERITLWLAQIERTAARSYGLAVEVAQLQRLVKGYGETHERGWRNFTTVAGHVDVLCERADGAKVLAALAAAALADEHGKALEKALSELHASPA